MRNAFADELMALAARDERIVLLSGDIGNRIFDPFKQAFPDRFYNCGVAEASMMSLAAGLALTGLRPVVYTITTFATYRCFEQIRVGVAYHDAPVIIVGTGSGLSYASLGPTHHSLEDMAILRAVPGMTVLAPCDSNELRAGLAEALTLDAPCYIRIGKKGEPLIHETPPALTIGKAITLRDGSDICLIGSGTITSVVIDAAEWLGDYGISARVESFPSIKPLDEERLGEIFGRFDIVAVAEEHGRIGGLYGAIAEWLAGQPDGKSARLLAFGTDDRFMHTIGSQAYARESFGLSASHIGEACRHALGQI